MYTGLSIHKHIHDFCPTGYVNLPVHLHCYSPIYIPIDHVHLDPFFPVNHEDLPLHSPPREIITLVDMYVDSWEDTTGVLII